MKKYTLAFWLLIFVISNTFGQISLDSLRKNYLKNLLASQTTSLKKQSSVCREDSSVHYMYDTASQTYSKVGLDIYEYTTSSKLSKVRYYFMNASNWLPSAMITYSYDVSGNLILEEPIPYGSTNNISNQKKIFYTYDIYNNLVSQITQAWNPNTQSWSNYSRQTFTYSANSKISTLITDTWSSGTQTWSSNYKYAYYYSAAGTVTLQTNKIFAPSTSTWKNRDSVAFYYTNSKLTSVISSAWTNASSSYTVSYKSTFSYDASGNQIDLLGESWDNLNSTWKNYQKNTTPYNSAGLISSDEEYHWSPSQQIWLKEQKLGFSYDSFNNLVQETDEYSSHAPNTWIIYGKSMHIYDCSNAVGISSLYKKSNVVKLYPNPGNSEVFIDSEEEFSEVVVIDLTGKKILSAIENTSLDVSRLPNGIYFIQFLDKDRSVFATEKFVKQ